jgi:hypothetical protein
MSTPTLRPLPLVATAALLGAGLLSACYVVPIDPRTGRPLPISDGAGGPTTAPAPILLPPAPPAPSPLQARLYPLNEPANAGGLLVAQVIDNHTGRGSITLQYRGALLQGESTSIGPGYAAYGRIHREVLGSWTAPTSGKRGIANAYGPGGVNAQCEYVLTGPSLGTGACLFSDGAKYQMHFGQ